MSIRGSGLIRDAAGDIGVGIKSPLDPNGNVEVVLQDDLTGLLSFKIIACGHAVID